MPRFAAASTPGSNFFSPFLIACSMSSVPDDAVFGRAHRQIHQADFAPRHRQFFAARHSGAAVIAQTVRLVRVATKRAVRNHADLWEERGQCAHRGGFRGAAFAADQHTADHRIDRVQHERAFHFILIDDRGKREYRCSHFLALKKIAPLRRVYYMPNATRCKHKKCDVRELRRI